MGPGREHDHIELRHTPTDLAGRYWKEGLWTDDTMATLLHAGLRANAQKPLRVWSATRPYTGTIGAVHELAQRVAGGLRQRGITERDVVAFQLPNCVEAAAVFWGVSLLGATLVPIVHSYGPKEVGFILEEARPRVFVTADHHCHLDYLQPLPELRKRSPGLELVIVVGTDAADDTARFDDLITANLRIQRRKCLQGTDHGPGEKRHEAEADAVAFEKRIPAPSADVHDRRHVHLVKGGQHRRGALCLEQALRNRLATARHADPRFAALAIR